MADDNPTLHGLDKRVSLVEQSHEHLATQMEQINSNLRRLVWGVFGALGLAVMQFVINGGLRQ